MVFAAVLAHLFWHFADLFQRGISERIVVSTYETHIRNLFCEARMYRFRFLSPRSSEKQLCRETKELRLRATVGWLSWNLNYEISREIQIMKCNCIPSRYREVAMSIPIPFAREKNLIIIRIDSSKSCYASHVFHQYEHKTHTHTVRYVYVQALRRD